MNLADIRALVAVVETGSLAHAAVKLGLTQPAVTRRIQRLEQALAVQLLDRDMKPARLTAEGRTAYSECVRVLGAAEGLKNALGRRPDPARPLRVGVSFGSADLVLAALLNMPEAAGEVAFETGPSGAIERAVAERRFDAGLVLRDPGREPESGGERLASLPVAVIASRGASIPARPTLRALRGRRWVLCPDGCGFRRALEHGMYGAAQPLDIAAALWGFEQQVALVAAGVGLGLVPSRVLAISAHADKVRIVKVADFNASLDLWLVTSEPAGAKEARFAPFRAALGRVLDATGGDGGGGGAMPHGRRA